MKKGIFVFLLMTLFIEEAQSNAMIRPENFLPFGLNISYSKGFQLGGEVSFVHFDGYWYGIYADSVYNFKKENWRGSIGPEFGVLYLGGDAGLLLEQKANHVETGITARVMFSAVYAHAYLRFNYLFNNEASFEFGLLFKFPASLGR